MSSYEDEDDYPYEDEDEEIELPSTNEFRIENLPDFPGGERCAPVLCVVSGDLSGDIKWNNANAIMKISVPPTIDKKAMFDANTARYGTPYYERHLSVEIKPFTSNCGAKAISHIGIMTHQIYDEQNKQFLKYIESFLYHKCNCGILVGSDCIDFGSEPPYGGMTGNFIKVFGQGYVISEPVWNPNYTWGGAQNHKIFLFHKYLVVNELPDYWG